MTPRRLLALCSIAAALTLPYLHTRAAPARPGLDPAASSNSCAGCYNSLLTQAATALRAGDRAAALDALERARRLGSTCPALDTRRTPTLTAAAVAPTLGG